MAIGPRAGSAAPAASLRPALALTLAALFWSGNFIAGRAMRGQIDPVMLNFARWLAALVLLAPFAWQDACRNAGAIRREWQLILGLGASGIAAFHTLVYLALQTTTAMNALLLFSLSPVVILAGAILLGLESATQRQLAGATVSVTGAVILITRGDVTQIRNVGFTAGDLWMLLAVAIWSLYSLLLRRRPADLPQSAALAASIAARSCCSVLSCVYLPQPSLLSLHRCRSCLASATLRYLRPWLRSCSGRTASRSSEQVARVSSSISCQSSARSSLSLCSRKFPHRRRLQVPYSC